MKDIYIAGGCFWGVEEYYNRLKGIISTKVGYVNGLKDNLSYEEVKSQQYQAIECVYVTYDESIMSLEKILEHLFRIIDPTSVDKQGPDEGISYRVGAYYQNNDQKVIVEEFIKNQQINYDKPIVFEVKPFERFMDAEEYHQKYLVKNPTGYCHVNFSKIKPEERK